MSQLAPASTTVGDLCTAALKELGVLGVGQTPLAEETSDAWAKLQWMLQDWQRKRWMVYHLVTIAVTSTGATSYTVGPSGTFNTGTGTVRPARLESAFLRQLNSGVGNQPDYPLIILQSREDYNKIALKSLVSFPSAVFMDTDWPLANVYPWPIPQASIYALHLTLMMQLPASFASLATVINLPYEYYRAIVSLLAFDLAPKYPGAQISPVLLSKCKDAKNTLRTNNAQIARLGIPAHLSRDGIYNIYSDRSY